MGITSRTDLMQNKVLILSGNSLSLCAIYSRIINLPVTFSRIDFLNISHLPRDSARSKQITSMVRMITESDFRFHEMNHDIIQVSSYDYIYASDVYHPKILKILCVHSHSAESLPISSVVMAGDGLGIFPIPYSLARLPTHFFHLLSDKTAHGPISCVYSIRHLSIFDMPYNEIQSYLAKVKNLLVESIGFSLADKYLTTLPNLPNLADGIDKVFVIAMPSFPVKKLKKRLSSLSLIHI